MMTKTKHSERFFHLVSDLLACVGPDGTITSVNSVAEQVLGIAAEELVGRHWHDFVHPDDRLRTQEYMTAIAAGRPGPAGFANRYLTGGGDVVWIEWNLAFDGNLIYAGGRDVTSQRLAAQRVERSEALWRASFEQAAIGMSLLTLDGVVVDVNPALCSFMGAAPGELVGRSFTDFTAADDAGDAIANVMRLREGEIDHYEAERRYVRVDDATTVWGHVVVAVVATPDDGQRLLAQVIDITERKQEEQRLAADFAQLASLGRLRTALDEDRLVLHAQPIVDLATGETVREELLVRLEENGELLTPDRFLPAAERFGLIAEVDARVVEQAIDLARTGRAVNVNVSVLSLGDRLLHRVERAVAQGLDPALLSFEITETALAEDMGVVARFSERLHGLGCGLAIDDFGVGYGSLVYLKELTGLTCLKIDRGFVATVTESERDQEIVKALAGLGLGLGKYVVAEGVENRDTVEHLLQAGVRFGQGYLFGRPVPA